MCLVLVVGLLMSGQSWGVYEFADGFTVKSGATVNWNFDGSLSSTLSTITSPIVVEVDGVLNITASGQMKCSAGITVSGVLFIANSAGCGLQNYGVVEVNGILSIANSSECGLYCGTDATVNLKSGSGKWASMVRAN